MDLEYLLKINNQIIKDITIESNDEILNIDELNDNSNVVLSLITNCREFLKRFKLIFSSQYNILLEFVDLKNNLLKEKDMTNFLNEKLSEEKYLRRKVHNLYLQNRGNLRVMCRIRPFIGDESNLKFVKDQFKSNFLITNQSIRIKYSNKTYKDSTLEEKAFFFDYIFNQFTKQDEISEELFLMLQGLSCGKNISIICYGQTGTGKTYTVEGTQSNYGVIYTALKQIFKMKEENDFLLNQQMEGNEDVEIFKNISISISVCEIYNENIYNLFDENKYPLSIYEDNYGNLNIPDLNNVNVNSYQDALNLIKIANKLKQTRETQYNIKSSRSHTIFTINLKFIKDNNMEINSKLNIIDLAGSERISKNSTNNYSNFSNETNLKDDIIKKEAISINQSLSSLSLVINSILTHQKHIPFRNSKLTHLLKESFTNNFSILFILHISPNYKDYQETISTLNFGKSLYC